MNDQMRRYLDEDWDDYAEPAQEKRTSKPPPKPVAQDRRQKQKAWGRAIDKFHKERAKAQKQGGGRIGQ